MDRKTIYICIEIKSREYTSSILLAFACVLRGYRVYLGTHAAIYALIREKSTKDGIFLDKSTQPKERMKWNRQRTEYYCILDPELSPILSEEVLLEGFKSRVYAGTEALFDRFFVVGESAGKAARANIESIQSGIRVTGWPRIDVWKELGAKIHKNEISSIRAKNGNFLLFIPSFGSIRDPQVMKDVKNADPINVTLLNDFTLAQLQHNNFKRMIEMLTIWDQDETFPKVVIKTHPSEHISEWKRATKGLKKTIVVHKGDISPWILASSGVIHHGSTGAIEAHLGKKPVLIIKEFTVPFLLPIASGISEFEINSSSRMNGFNFSCFRNPDYNPNVLNQAVALPVTGSVDMIADNFDELEAKLSKQHKRSKLIISQMNRKSLRRSVGLIRDEIYWKLGKTNINSQYHFVPGGLDKNQIKKVSKIDSKFQRVRFRRMTINLWEFDSKPSH
jgi:surface carbohydrate biosynthesis protein